MSHEQVTRTSHQKPLRQNLKNLSKCFSRLEVPLPSQSRGEPRNLLSNPHNWSFHLQTSRPHESRKFQKPRFFENFLSLFRDWDFDPPESRENLLCKLATSLTREASRQNRVAQFLKFFKTKILSKNN